MCRMLAYSGPPLRLAQLVTAPAHSLLVQSYRAREQREAVVSADGWGAGWYLDADPDACVYRSTLPIWADANLPHLQRTIVSTRWLAAVRSATEPLSHSPANVQPFVHGRLLFVHNGFIRDFRSKLLRKLRAELDDATYECVRGDTDSEHLFYLLVDAYRSTPEGTSRLLEATRTMLHRLQSLLEPAQTQALLTFIVTDGDYLVYVKSAFLAEPPSLYVQRGAGHLVASEALDDSKSWQPVPADTIFCARSDGGVIQLPAWE